MMKLKTLLYSFCGIMITCLVISGWYAKNLLQELQRTHTAEVTSDKLYQTLLQMRRHEKDFLARKDLKYLQRFNQSYQQLTNESNLLSTQVTNNILGSRIREILTQSKTYHSNFIQLAKKLQVIGLKPNEGALKKLRDAANILDQAFTNHAHYRADILMLRRYEKDFLQRMDLKYVDKLKITYTDILGDLLGDKKETAYIPTLKNYLSSFLGVVNSYKRIGLNQNTGLRGDARKAAHKTEKIVGEVNQIIHSSGKYRSQKIYHALLLLGTFLSLLLIIGAIAMTRRVMGKTNYIITGIQQIKNSTHYDCTLPLQGKDEFTDIAIALNKMVTTTSQALSTSQASTSTLNAIMDNTPYGIWLIDPNGDINFVNKPLNRLLGIHYDEKKSSKPPFLEQVFDKNVANEFTFSDDPRTLNPAHRTLYSSVKTNLNNEPRDFKITRIQLNNDSGEITGLIGIAEDITESLKMEQEISYQATHDPLTRLMNRTSFEKKVSQLCRTAAPNDMPHVVAFLDLDQFKIVNDTCGHQAGDELLKQITELYSGLCREAELFKTDNENKLESSLSRLGGDEFGLLLYNCTGENARKVAQRLVDATADFRFVHEGRNFTIGCSIGMVTLDHTNSGLADIMQRADGACYTAKDKGRGRVQIATMDEEQLAFRRETANWVPKIHAAIEKNRFLIFAQTISPLSTNELGERFEILVRYLADDGSILPPAAFMPAAERFSLMHLIDMWVIDHAFQELETLYGEGKKRLLASASINLSGQSLGEDWLLKHIHKNFNKSSIRPEQICFEITETVAISNLKKATRSMNQLRNIGCRFALDDFGSGLSSFSYLNDLPLDYLKIDGSLVKDISTNPVNKEMVTAIHNIAKVMNLKTVAEFVENDEIASVLKDIGIHFGQGYGISKPMPLGETVVLQQPLQVPYIKSGEA